MLHLVSLTTIAVSIAAAAIALRAWRARRTATGHGAAGLAERTPFLALVATFGAALFSLVLITQWMAVLVLGPCDFRAPPRFAPTAFHQRETPLGAGLLRPPFAFERINQTLAP